MALSDAARPLAAVYHSMKVALRRAAQNTFLLLDLTGIYRHAESIQGSHCPAAEHLEYPDSSVS